jgi:hypothetical protein
MDGRRVLLTAAIAVMIAVRGWGHQIVVIHHPWSDPYVDKVGNKKITRSQEIAWHLKQAKSLVAHGKVDAAYAHWTEVLRLDPQNATAHAGVKQFAITGAKAALLRFSQADGLQAIAATLDNQTADIMGQRLLIADRQAIGAAVDNPVLTADPHLIDDFENFITANNLGAMTDIGDYISSPYEASRRLYGRRLVEQLAGWVPRIERAGIDIIMTRPHGYNAVATDPNLKFTLMGTAVVLIDGMTVQSAGVANLPPTPLQASYEDGAWRIGPRAGSLMLYAFDQSKHAPHRPRVVHVP